MDNSQSWLTTTDDPKAVSAARAAASQALLNQSEGVFQALEQPIFIDDETLRLLERDRERSIDRLNGLLDAGSISQESVGAALLLCRMHQESGRNYAKKILRDGSVDLRRQLLNQIDSVPFDESEKSKYQAFLFADADLVAVMLAQLQDADEQIVKAAIQCCGFLSVPGANDQFVKMLQTGSVPDKGRVLYWLSQGELTERLFDFAVEASKDVQTDDHWGASIYEAFAKSAEEPLQTRAKMQLLKILKGWPDKGKEGYQGNRLSILSTLSKAADANDLDWLRELVNSESGLYAVEPLAAYIRLSPQEGRKTLLQWLGDGEKRRAAIDAAGRSFAKSADMEIVQSIGQQAAVAKERELESICTALNSIGGVEAARIIESVGPKLDPATLSHFRQSRSEDSPEVLSNAVVSAGLLSKEEAQAAAERVNPESGEQPVRLFDLLALANSAIAFDVETGMLPCRHDTLVNDFAKASRGRFQPSSVLEVWHQSDPDDFDAAYTLQFVLNETLYKAEIRNRGDWYDVERTVEAINTSLARAGVRDRFIGLASEGQIALFVFAEPEVFSGLAKRFNVAVSDDFESAMRKGVEFEERVRQRLEESDE